MEMNNYLEELNFVKKLYFCFYVGVSAFFEICICRRNQRQNKWIIS